MKRLCAFIICAVILTYTSAHILNTKDETKEIKTEEIKQATQITKSVTVESDVTNDKEINDTTASAPETTTKEATTTELVINTTNSEQANNEQTTNTTKPTPDVTEPITESHSVFYLTDYERSVVEYIVMGEAGGETYEGQVLVAQCLLNACLKENLQPSEIRRKYQYSGWNSNPSESVKKAVSAVFDDGYKATSEFILYFYSTKYGHGQWHETQKFVCEVGSHRFFAEW